MKQNFPNLSDKLIIEPFEKTYCLQRLIEVTK
jgi:hypothetical protein